MCDDDDDDMNMHEYKTHVCACVCVCTGYVENKRSRYVNNIDNAGSVEDTESHDDDSGGGSDSDRGSGSGRGHGRAAATATATARAPETVISNRNSAAQRLINEVDHNTQYECSTATLAETEAATELTATAAADRL